MSKKEYDKFFKTLVIGDTCVGKLKFIQGYVDEDNRNILNNDSRFKIITCDGLKIKFLLTKYVYRPSGGGSNTTVYKNTQCFLIIFDVCDLDSLHSVKLWVREITRFSQDDTPIIIIGNKIDLNEKRQVKNEEVIEFIEEIKQDLQLKLNIPYFEISSLKPDQSQYDNIFKQVYSLSNQRFYNPLVSFDEDKEVIDDCYSDIDINDDSIEKKIKKEKRKSKSFKKIVSIFKK
ncbi:hypothetical protein ACTA71_010271 [Dictyostelium dimigraforme]